jgi:hypothetical protein
MRKRAFVFISVVVGAFAVCAVYLHWRVNRVSLADLPYLQMETYDYRNAYRVDPYIQVAHRLQVMGKAAACKKLLALSDSEHSDYDEKIAVLCRMLFAKRLGSDFRPAGIGDFIFFGGTDSSDWPLAPIEIIDGVPFDITWGYTLHGNSEPPQEYIRYCMSNCTWSEIKFEHKTKHQKNEALAKLLVRFSRARKRYERQGLLVTEEALAKAEEECAADAPARAAARKRAGFARQEEDREFVTMLTQAIRQRYPSCPTDETRRIAEHTGCRSSGRVGRSTAGRALDASAVDLAVIAHIRHAHTNYDELLMCGTERLDARAQVREKIDRVLAEWSGA